MSDTCIFNDKLPYRGLRVVVLYNTSTPQMIFAVAKVPMHALGNMG